MPSWNAAQYLRFGDERTRPCRDLAARVAVDARRVIDLGCGPGNSTAVLAGRWPAAEITGLDSSPEMLEAARAAYPQISWLHGDIARWRGDGFDVVFSNAALQWVPDHDAVFPRLLECVSPGGALAVQMPARCDSPAQRLIRELARERIADPVSDWDSRDLAFYYDALAPHSSSVDFWETEYAHVLDGPEGIVEWYKGTGLRPFLAALPEDARPAFLAEYLRRVTAAYPHRAGGKVLFPFRRLFLIAYR